MRSSIVSIIGLLCLLQINGAYVSSIPNSIESAIASIESSEISDQQHKLCSLSDPSTKKIIQTNFGSFAVCATDFLASVKFFDLNGGEYTLAYFGDGELDLYETNKILNGNMCSEVYNKIGESCFAHAAQTVALSYLPTWKNSMNVSESVVSSFITSTFSPQVSQYGGLTGRCYPNTGTFKIIGLAADQAQNAVTLRNSVYDGCEITQGDRRFWGIISWSYQRIGALIVSGGAMIVATFIPCLSCCLR